MHPRRLVLAGCAALLSLVGGVTAFASQATGETLALDAFRQICFPKISSLQHVRSQAEAAGFSVVEASIDKRLESVAKFLKTSRSVTIGEKKITSGSKGLFAFQKNEKQTELLAIANHKTGSSGELINCLIFNFDQQSLSDPKQFDLAYNTLVIQHALNPRYLRTAYSFFGKEISGPPLYSSGMKIRSKQEAGVTGLYLAASGFVE